MPFPSLRRFFGTKPDLEEVLVPALERIRGDLPPFDTEGIGAVRGLLEYLEREQLYTHLDPDECTVLRERIYNHYWTKCLARIELKLEMAFELDLDYALEALDTLLVQFTALETRVPEIRDYPEAAKQLQALHERTRNLFRQTFAVVIQVIQDAATRGQLVRCKYFTPNLLHGRAEDLGRDSEPYRFARDYFQLLHWRRSLVMFPSFAESSKYQNLIHHLGFSVPDPVEVGFPEAINP